jgi:hypothetical protein
LENATGCAEHGHVQNAARTGATFSAPSTYTRELTASDAEFTRSDRSYAVVKSP